MGVGGVDETLGSSYPLRSIGVTDGSQGVLGYLLLGHPVLPVSTPVVWRQGQTDRQKVGRSVVVRSRPSTVRTTRDTYTPSGPTEQPRGRGPLTTSITIDASPSLVMSPVLPSTPETGRCKIRKCSGVGQGASESVVDGNLLLARLLQGPTPRPHRSRGPRRPTGGKAGRRKGPD